MDARRCAASDNGGRRDARKATSRSSRRVSRSASRASQVLAWVARYGAETELRSEALRISAEMRAALAVLEEREGETRRRTRGTP